MPKTILLILFIWLSFYGQAQKPPAYNAGQIQLALDKLNVLGSVLYVAAHPDDENTRLIAYLGNEDLYKTAYLSVTRGDGGQNLIGPEIRDDLGIIRSQELLAARRLDGGEQFFTRANDFGFSKHPDETLQIWDKDKVLEDYVQLIRQLRPDVMITRFNIEPGTTHGHHTASAQLAQEAFRLAGDKNAYPDQLDRLEVWQPKKLFWNTSWWFYQSTGQKLDTTGLVRMDVGTYNHLLGKSYTEIAAESRSMHKSQGFGSTGSRGTEIEYLMQWEGEKSKTIFEGIDVTWGRVAGGEKIGELLQNAAALYQPSQPKESLRFLFQAREELSKLPDQFWKEEKLKALDEVVRAIAGAYFEVVANDYAYVAGDSISFEVEAISRKDVSFILEEVIFEPWGQSVSINQSLKENERFNADYQLVIPENTNNTSHYWLNSLATNGMYHVPDKQLIGKPENDPVFTARFIINWQGQYLEYTRPVVYKRNDPVKGETYRPVEITPVAMVNIESSVMVFGDNAPQKVEARIISGKTNLSGTLSLLVPAGWTVSPESKEVSLKIKAEEQLHAFQIFPPKGASEGNLTIQFVADDGASSELGRVQINYDHIPVQTYFPKTSVRLVRLDLNKFAGNIGYIDGAGDAIPGNLRQIGYQVSMLTQDDITASNLKKYDAVIVGVRAFNTNDWLSYKNKELFEYVELGGTVIVQYNTNRGLVTPTVAPYDLKLSRDRVTVEEAEVRIVNKKHPVLNFPNKITATDFKGWVQERGLYFPGEWDQAFEAVISTNDPGEAPLDGGLLVARYGEGYYIYSGYSWFRQLPAGVPGAYRLFVNMISIGKSNGKIK